MVKKKFGSFFALLFLVFLVFYLIINRELLRPLLDVPLGIVLLLATIKISQIFINGLFTKFTLNAFGKPINHKESAYVALLSSLGNYFGPLLGGLGLRAAYLKKKHNFSLTHFVGATYGYYLISFFTSASVGLISLLVIYNSQGVYSPFVTVALLIVLLLTGVLFFLKVPKRPDLQTKKYIGNIYKRLMQIAEGWEILSSNKKLFTRMLALGLGMLFIGFLTAYVEFLALGIPFTVPALLVYTSLGAMSLLVSFTPGAIGIRESIYILSSSVLLLTNNEILQLAAIDRGVSISVLLVGYVYLRFINRLRLKRAKE